MATEEPTRLITRCNQSLKDMRKYLLMTSLGACKISFWVNHDISLAVASLGSSPLLGDLGALLCVCCGFCSVERGLKARSQHQSVTQPFCSLPPLPPRLLTSSPRWTFLPSPAHCKLLEGQGLCPRAWSPGRSPDR